MNRRSFLAGLICAPAIVRSGILMPVKRILTPDYLTLEEFFRRLPNRNVFLDHLTNHLTTFPDHGWPIGSVLRIRLPNDYQIRSTGNPPEIHGTTRRV